MIVTIIFYFRHFSCILHSIFTHFLCIYDICHRQKLVISLFYPLTPYSFVLQVNFLEFTSLFISKLHHYFQPFIKPFTQPPYSYGNRPSGRHGNPQDTQTQQEGQYNHCPACTPSGILFHSATVSGILFHFITASPVECAARLPAINTVRESGY